VAADGGAGWSAGALVQPPAVGAAGTVWVRCPAVLVRYWEPLALGAVLVVACALRFDLLSVRPLWFDEAFSLNTARQTFSALWEFFKTNDSHPIGYYALLSAWIRWFGTGLAAMRMLSLLFGVAAVALTWAVGRRMCSPQIGVVAAALVALHPYQIFSSNELRMYAPLTALALVSTWCVWRAADPGAPWWRWALYGTSVAAMGYVSYYAWLLVPAQVLWLASVLPWRRAAVCAGLAGAVALAWYAPWIPVIVTLPQRLPWAWRTPVNPYWLASLLTSQTFGTYLFDTGSYFTIGHVPFPTYSVLLFPFGVLLAVGVAVLGRVNGRARGLIVLSWLLPIVLVVVVSLAVGRQFAFPRHLVFVEPFAALLLAAGIVHAGGAARPGSRARLVLPLIAGGLVLAFAIPVVANVNDASMLPYRWDLAAQLVRTEIRRGDIIVYFPGVMSEPLDYYYQPRAPQLFVTPSSHGWTERDIEPGIREAIALIVKGSYRRVWLVFSTPWPPGSLEAFSRGLEHVGYRQGSLSDFREVWVAKFDRTAAAVR